MRTEIKLPTSPDELRTLFGPNDANLRMLRSELDVTLVARNNRLLIEGTEANVERAVNVAERMIDAITQGQAYLEDELSVLVEMGRETEDDQAVIHTERKKIAVKTSGQGEYVSAIRNHSLVFGIGPAGTGKTYLAVACAVEALRHGKVKKLVLTRPAVEAGERLGFLPGDMREKVDPYLRPIYDALDEMLSRRQLSHYTETGVIEVAPLAFMRGRTLHRSFVILDEAQNTTPGQMKMLLTRLGPHARCVVTGDLTQIDLQDCNPSGLLHASTILADLADVKTVRLTGKDIVRHRLVKDIVEAYDQDASQPEHAGEF
jgi:phosphate starvation-inducible PhoH-like protein